MMSDMPLPDPSDITCPCLSLSSAFICMPLVLPAAACSAEVSIMESRFCRASSVSPALDPARMLSLGSGPPPSSRGEQLGRGDRGEIPSSARGELRHVYAGEFGP